MLKTSSQQEKVRGLSPRSKDSHYELIAESPNYFERLKVADNSFDENHFKNRQESAFSLVLPAVRVSVIPVE